MPPPWLSAARRCTLGAWGWLGGAGRRGTPAPLAPGGSPRRGNTAARGGPRCSEGAFPQHREDEVRQRAPPRRLLVAVASHHAITAHI